MDWKSIVGPVLQSAAPKLAKGLLGQIPVVGPIAVALGGQAIDDAFGMLLGQVFDVPPTPEAVGAAIQNLPSDEVAAKLKAAENLAEAKWPALAQIAVAEEQTAQVQIATTAAVMKEELMAASTLPEGFWRTFDIVINSIWRPMFALEFLIECAFFFFGMTTVLLGALVRNDQFDIDSMVKLQPLALTLLMPYLAMRCGLIGYHMNLRTRDKENVTDAVTDTKPVSMADVMALLKGAGVKIR